MFCKFKIYSNIFKIIRCWSIWYVYRNKDLSYCPKNYISWKIVIDINDHINIFFSWIYYFFCINDSLIYGFKQLNLSTNLKQRSFPRKTYNYLQKLHSMFEMNWDPEWIKHKNSLKLTTLHIRSNFAIPVFISI